MGAGVVLVMDVRPGAVVGTDVVSEALDGTARVVEDAEAVKAIDSPRPRAVATAITMATRRTVDDRRSEMVAGS